MKKFFLLTLVVGVMMFSTGCSGNGSGATDTSSVFSSDDMAALEASLIVDRMLAATETSDSAGNLLASTDGEGMFRYRNRQYRSQNGAAGLGLQRGMGTCMAVISENRLSIGTEQCSLEKLETGEIVITRGNGSVITVPAPDNLNELNSFTVGEILWETTYGNNPGDPLVEMRNTRSGLKLSISENDDGTLTITRDLSEVFSGRWAENGDLELADKQGKRFRYRYGKAN